jgi:hypothetical protein
MKNILLNLNQVISELETSGQKKVAKKLNKVFNKIAEQAVNNRLAFDGMYETSDDPEKRMPEKEYEDLLGDPGFRLNDEDYPMSMHPHPHTPEDPDVDEDNPFAENRNVAPYAFKDKPKTKWHVSEPIIKK